MSSDSVLYTIGTALNRAHDNDVPVQILVEGQWLSGRVAAVDGHGVVLHCRRPRARGDPDGQRVRGAVFTAAPQRSPRSPAPQADAQAASRPRDVSACRQPSYGGRDPLVGRGERHPHVPRRRPAP